MADDEIMGFPIRVSPDCPPDKIYLINPDQLDPETRRLFNETTYTRDEWEGDQRDAAE